jgi:glutamate 5-kinase
MISYRYKRIAVKVGSNVLTNSEGQLDLNRLKSIVQQISALIKGGTEVILISSGAVASGRNMVHPVKKLDPIDQRQLYSAVGQTILINHYYQFFQENGLLCGQVLTTKENFHSRRHYLNQKNCMKVMLDNNVIPIVNENDTISVTELMFTDNDELSGLIAAMMNVDALIILSNIDGIYNGNPTDPSSTVIPTIKPGEDFRKYVSTEKSAFGRGGMLTKMSIARKVAEEGITVYIANGSREHILTDLLDEGKEVVCTRFLAGSSNSSAVKKWIAHSDGFAKGAVHINEGCLTALLGEKASSLLPVGITRVEGDFEKGDIIRIYNPEGKPIGIGKAQYGSVSAKDVAGRKGEKPLVHYDYLYLD